MTAVLIRFRSELRAHGRSWLVLAVLAGLSGGLVIGAFAGARRTDSALDRLVAHSGRQDVSIAKGFVFQNSEVDFERIERLPEVVRSSRDRPLAALIRTRSGEQMYGGHARSVIPLASPDGSQLVALNRPKLLAGRLPDPRRPDEILADEKAAAIMGLEPGDPVLVRFIWRRLLGTPRVDFGADPERAPVGPLARLRVAGIHARTVSDDVSGHLVLPPRVYRAHGGTRLASFQEILNVGLRRGEADIPAFRAAVERIAGSADFRFDPTAADRAKVQRSIDLQVRTVRLVAALGAVAALILLVQALWRQAEQGSADYPTLRAFGMTRGQLVAVGLSRAGSVAAGAALVAVVAAIALSPLTPIGRARTLEPDPGLAFDGAVLAIGAIAVLAAVVLAGALAAGRAAAAAGAPPRPAARGTATLAGLGLPPAMLVGTRLALAAGHGAMRPAIVGAISAVAVAALAVTFSASLGRLLTTPSLYGQNWEYEAPFDPRYVPALRAGDDVPGLPPLGRLSGVAVGTGSRLAIDGKLVGVSAYDALKGTATPSVVAGRAPRRADEILLARRTLDALDVRIGDRVEVRRGPRAVRMRVVGEGVVAESEWVQFGEGAALTFAGFKRVVPDAILFDVHLRLAPGPERDAALTQLERHFDWPGPGTPGAVGDFGGIRSLPALVAALAGAAAAAALAHALVSSVRRRRRELAILKTLGFVRGQVLGAVAWQAAIVADIALVVGLPLGIAAGRYAWNVFAEDLGVVPDPFVPAVSTLLLVPATLALAVVIAALPARMAARIQPAPALRTE